MRRETHSPIIHLLRSSLPLALALLLAACGVNGTNTTTRPPAEPEIVNFSSADTVVALGSDTVLSWEVSNADTLMLEPVGDVTGVTSVTVTPTESTTYTLRAENAFGATEQSLTVDTGSAPSIELSAAPAPYRQNTLAAIEHVNVNFTVDDADSASVSVTVTTGDPALVQNLTQDDCALGEACSLSFDVDRGVRGRASVTLSVRDAEGLESRAAFEVVVEPRRVTNTDDAGVGSLREAIGNAAAGDVIAFDLDFGSPKTIELTSELLVDKSLTVEGPGADLLTVSGGDTTRVLKVGSGATVNVSGLRIADGFVSFVLGGSGQNVGGGIYNAGTLTLVDMVLDGNKVVDGGAMVASGGGIYNEGSLTLIRSAVTRNQATGTLAMGSGWGGGIDSTGSLTLINSTVANNTSTMDGGGIYATGNVVLLYSTIAHNSAGAFATGGVQLSGTDPYLKGNIIADNTSPYGVCPNLCSDQAFYSEGYNLVEDHMGNFNPAGSDLTGPAAQVDLDGLADNGGPTETIALQDSSPALDVIPLADCTDDVGGPLTVDQRGLPRPAGAGGCDIGAFERQ